MNKLLFTKLRGRTVSVLVSEKRVLQIEAAPLEHEEPIGAVYIGKVRNVIKNLNAAFVEYRPGVNGYYSLAENPVHVFADGRPGNSPIKSGDEILVQVSRAAVKTKDAVLSSDFNLTGRYAVLSLRDTKFGVSSKITDKKWREEIKSMWEERGSEDYGVIIRTNAYGVPPEKIWEETEILYKMLKKILASAQTRTCYTMLYKPGSFALQTAFGINASETGEIVTDIPEIYDELLQAGFCPKALEESVPGIPSLRFYDDTSYPMTALYHLESSLDRALSKTVWLRSGGYLVIEPTEAMTVIDVNTGKNTAKKTASETYFKTNMEAADEIAVQLRLRNLSGIIIIDFIDMEKKEQRHELLSHLRKRLSSDPVKTVLVDMTALGLVEVTRKKIKMPLYQQFM